MESSERASLLAHLNDQAAILARMAAEATSDGEPEMHLIAIRDQVFVIKETLGSLEVPYSLVSHDEWRGATERSGGA